MALLKKLKVQAKNNFLSRQLNANADKLVAEMSKLSGAAFDRRYASNELSYHRAVNTLVERTFIPKLQNRQVKALFRQALATFKAHQRHANAMDRSLSRHNSMMQ